MSSNMTAEITAEITAIATAVAAGVALIATGVSGYVLVWQTNKTVRNQALLQLLGFWQSEPMFPRIRCNAAKATNLDIHVEDVLDFFETVAFLTKSGAISLEMAHSTFFWPMVMYWSLYKVDIRGGGPLWDEYCHLMPRLILFEKRKMTCEEAQKFEQTELTRERALGFMKGEEYRCCGAEK